jgi:hypothetical protein
MTRQIQWFALLLIVPSLAVILEAQQPFVHGSDVVFAIRADQSKHVMGEPIIVRYTVRNVSDGALFVPKSQWGIECGDPPHLWVRLEDKSGKHYEPGYGGSCLGPSPEHRVSVSQKMQKDATLVKPGQMVYGSFTFQTKVLSDLKPGSYRLEAVLHGWNLPFNTSELTELQRMGAPFLIGETHASTHVELRAASRN